MSKPTAPQAVPQDSPPASGHPLPPFIAQLRAACEERAAGRITMGSLLVASLTVAEGTHDIHEFVVNAMADIVTDLAVLSEAFGATDDGGLSLKNALYHTRGRVEVMGQIMAALANAADVQAEAAQ